MGHRVRLHGGQCKTPHGHRYAAEITVSGPVGDDGFVLDFGEIKAKVGAWVDRHLDHTTAMEIGDAMMERFSALNDDEGLKPFYKMYGPPTAENLASLIGTKALELLDGFHVERVVVYETPSCWAEWKCTR